MLGTTINPRNIRTAISFRQDDLTRIFLRSFTMITSLKGSLSSPILQRLRILAMFTIDARRANGIEIFNQLNFFRCIFQDSTNFFNIRRHMTGPTGSHRPLIVTIARS